MNNGIHLDVPRNDYDLLLERWNYSTLKHFKKSALHVKYEADQRPKTLEQLEARTSKAQRDTLLRGEATHVCALEPALYGGQDAEKDEPEQPGRFLVFGGTRDERHERYKKVLARASLARKKIITEDMDVISRAIAKGIRSNTDVAPYIVGGSREVTVLWDDIEPQVGMLDGYATPMKCRLDYLTDVAVIDLKTAASGSPEDCQRAFWNLGYFEQAAMQQDAVAAITRRVRPYFWLVVEPEPPYACALYEPDPIGMQMGRNTYRGWLQQLHACQQRELAGEANAWPGYTAGGVMQLSPPRWAMPRMEDAFA